MVWEQRALRVVQLRDSLMEFIEAKLGEQREGLFVAARAAWRKGLISNKKFKMCERLDTSYNVLRHLTPCKMSAILRDFGVEASDTIGAVVATRVGATDAEDYDKLYRQDPWASGPTFEQGKELLNLVTINNAKSKIQDNKEVSYDDREKRNYIQKETVKEDDGSFELDVFGASNTINNVDAKDHDKDSDAAEPGSAVAEETAGWATVLGDGRNLRDEKAKIQKKDIYRDVAWDSRLAEVLEQTSLGKEASDTFDIEKVSKEAHHVEALDTVQSKINWFEGNFARGVHNRGVATRGSTASARRKAEHAAAAASEAATAAAAAAAAYSRLQGGGHRRAAVDVMD